MKKTIIAWSALGIALVAFLALPALASPWVAVKGKILLQVESKGEAWYVYPKTMERYYLARPADAFDIMRNLGLGISNANLAKIPVGELVGFELSNNLIGNLAAVDATLVNNLKGQILLQVEKNGEAWYLSPVDGKRYYMGRPAKAFEIMRKLGLGITNDNLEKIVVAQKSKAVGLIDKIKTTTPTAEVVLLKSNYKCGNCLPGERCVAGQCVTTEVKVKNTCGNYICESGESYNGKATLNWGAGGQCYLDCQAPCVASNCNEYATVECACDQYDVLKERHGCVKSESKCSSCASQETLFPEVLKIQTEVVKCLSNYFEYKPPRLVYKVFSNPAAGKCTQGAGCEGIEGGVGGADYVLFNNLNGIREYNQNVPTKAEHITADVHETTHYFLYQMLHGAPSWFQEAVAIQTNERLNCTSRQVAWGDGYLSEKGDTKGGMVLRDGIMTYDFYRNFRDGEVALTTNEISDSHILGGMFIMGLKEDYKCGLDCVKDIVIKLREEEIDNCRAGSGTCSIAYYGNIWSLYWLGAGDKIGAEKITNGIIKKVIDEVVGKDTSALFGRLQIGYTL